MADPQEPLLTLDALQDAPRETLLEVIRFLLAENARLKQRIDALEQRLNANSTNSSKPPSSDSPYATPTAKASGKKGKAGAKPGHKGTRYQILAPTTEIAVVPESCRCGHREFTWCKPYYTHQHLELPEVRLTVI